MHNTLKLLLLFVSTLSFLITGCGENVEFQNPFAKQKAQPATPVVTQTTQAAAPVKKKQTKEEEALAIMFRSASMRKGSRSLTKSGGSTASRMNVSDAMGRINTELNNSVDFAPTLVVWMVDATESASSLRTEFTKAATKIYTELKTNGFKSKPKQEDVLKTAIVSFGETTTFLTEAPTSSFDEVLAKLGEIPSDPSGKETTFAAVQEVLDKYGDYRTKQNREIMIVIISDEAGDDQTKLDAVVTSAKQIGVRIHAIGVPAPLGRKAPDAPATEKRSDGMPAIVQGPETRHPQRVGLKFGASGFANEEIDSGFGPFALNYLCRSTGGAYLMAKPSSIGWPGNAMRFDDDKMRSYAPQYLTDQQYQTELSSNAALKALHDASARKMVSGLAFPSTQFTVRDEAQMKNDLDAAQRVAAVLEPPTRDLYEMLDRGEKDRDKITNKRWQVSFDLAYGRAGAARSRVEGYNSMLAIMKGGRKFEDPDKDTWYLEPADTLKEAGSKLEKTRAKAQMYLERIVKEHPGTPWAHLAARELETPFGWEWKE